MAESGCLEQVDRGADNPTSYYKTIMKPVKGGQGPVWTVAPLIIIIRTESEIPLHHFGRCVVFIKGQQWLRTWKYAKSVYKGNLSCIFHLTLHTSFMAYYELSDKIL
jgi:hypothetical protein